MESDEKKEKEKERKNKSMNVVRVDKISTNTHRVAEEWLLFNCNGPCSGG